MGVVVLAVGVVMVLVMIVVVVVVVVLVYGNGCDGGGDAGFKKRLNFIFYLLLNTLGELAAFWPQFLFKGLGLIAGLRLLVYLIFSLNECVRKGFV